MKRLVIVGMALFGIAACASAPPESNAPVASVDTEQSRATSGAALPENAQASDSPIEVVEIPKEETVVADAKADTMICRKVRTVGTNRTTRVCRTRGQIEAERAAARETLRENQMRTSGAVGGE